VSTGYSQGVRSIDALHTDNAPRCEESVTKAISRDLSLITFNTAEHLTGPGRETLKREQRSIPE